jgi:hypothetical protein
MCQMTRRAIHACPWLVARPVDYLRAHASDLGHLRRLEAVQDLLQRLRTLRVDDHDLGGGNGAEPLPSALGLLSLK